MVDQASDTEWQLISHCIEVVERTLQNDGTGLLPPASRRPRQRWRPGSMESFSLQSEILQSAKRFVFFLTVI